MYYAKFLFFLLVLVSFIRCSPKIVPTSGEEDFSRYRARYEYQRYQPGQVQAGKVIEIPLRYDSTTQQYDVTVVLNKRLDYVAPIYSNVSYRPVNVEGWRIQIYRGRDREAASEARQRVYELFSNRITPYLTYQRLPTG
ncbi:MAG: hypothetical protein HC880_15405 [Bacteroidia bacterium]|nr:hypothetical protein [Bacteroidia bacterium]